MNSSSTGILRKPSQQHQQLWVPSAQGKEIYLDVFRQILEQTYLHASTTDFPAQVLILFLKQRSGLSEEMVNLIWQISDSKNRGALNFDEFCICCRLISIAQSGKIPSSETLQSTSWMPLDYPKIQGVQINDAIIQRNSSVGSGSMSTSASGMASEFIISQTLRAQYLNVYNNTLYPVNNKVHVKTLQNYILQQPNVEPLMCKRILEMCKIALDYMNEYDEDEAIAALHLTSLVSKKAKSGTFDLPINLPLEILPLHRRGNVKKGKSLEDEANALLDELDNEKKKKDEYIAKQQNEIKMKNENEMRLKKEKVLRASCEKQAALLLKERETLNMLTALLQESKAVNQFETSHLELLYSLKTKQEQHTDRMQREKVYLKKMINLKGKEDPLLNEIAQVNSQSGFEFNANIPNSSNDDFLINAGGVATNNNNNFTNAPQFQMNNSGPSMPMYNNISNPIMSNVNMSNSSNNYSEQQQQQQFLISPKSSVAIERLKGLDLQLKEIERTIKGYSDSITHLDALPKPNDLLIIKTSLELLSGKVEQLQSKEIDSVSSFGLTSENEIKNMRKQLNSRCEVLHSLIVKTHTELNTVLDIVNVA